MKELLDSHVDLVDEPWTKKREFVEVEDIFRFINHDMIYHDIKF